MITDTITIRGVILSQVDEVTGPSHRTEVTFEAPSWCSGDPKAAVALYSFGYREATLRVVEAGVVETGDDDAYCEACSGDPDDGRACSSTRHGQHIPNKTQEV